jgi:hypothetical protein
MTLKDIKKYIINPKLGDFACCAENCCVYVYTKHGWVNAFTNKIEKLKPKKDEISYKPINENSHNPAIFPIIHALPFFVKNLFE